MTNRQRMENDTMTIDRRDMEDKTISDNRIRNDGLTRERRYNADKAMEKSRTRNDEITAERREVKDGNFSTILAVSLLISIFAVLAVEVFFIFR